MVTITAIGTYFGAIKTVRYHHGNRYTIKAHDRYRL